MINLILKDLVLWLFGLFLDLMNFCANALLGLMNTDLSYFESNVPIVVKLYGVFTAIGWGFLIGNCAFQCLKAMFAGLGFETESPAILLVRTFLFGFLLIMSKQVCEIGLSIGKTLMELIGLPESASIKFPDEAYFPDLTSSWLLIVIIGILIGSQLIKLFFEIGERYAVVAILTLFSPIAFAMGGSRSTKDICSGFIRTYASMLLLLVSNVLFLRLIFSAMSAMPNGAMILPWTVLVTGIAKTARKADNLLSKIGLNPTYTGDPLGNGMGKAIAFTAARSIIYSAVHKAGGKYTAGNKAGKAGYNGKNNTGNSRSSTGTAYSKNTSTGRNTVQSSSKTNVGVSGGSFNSSSNVSSNTSVRNSQSVNSGGFGKASAQSAGTSRFGTDKAGAAKTQKETKLENGNAVGKKAQNNIRNISKNGGNKNNPTAQKFGGKPVAGKQFGAKAWKPDKSFNHNPVGKRFGQTDTPPDENAEKVKENEQER